MKKLISVLLMAALLCIVCCSVAGEKEQPEILADYDSTHDYLIGELDFIRVYPKMDISH